MKNTIVLRLYLYFLLSILENSLSSSLYEYLYLFIYLSIYLSICLSYSKTSQLVCVFPLLILGYKMEGGFIYVWVHFLTSHLLPFLPFVLIECFLLQLLWWRINSWFTYQEDSLLEVALLRADVLNSYLHIVDYSVLLILGSGMEKIEVYSNFECSQTKEVVIVLGQTIGLMVWGCL